MGPALSGLERPSLAATEDFIGNTTKVGYLRHKRPHTDVAALGEPWESRLEESTSAGRMGTGVKY